MNSYSKYFAPQMQVVWSPKDRAKPTDCSKMSEEERCDHIINKLKYTPSQRSFQIGEQFFSESDNSLYLCIGKGEFVRVANFGT